MAILLKKALRSIWRNKRAYLACILLIAIGTMLFVAMGATSVKLELAKEQYYKEKRLADVFATVTAIPATAKDRLLAIEGVEDVSLRLVEDVRVLIPGDDRVITLRVVSVDPTEENPINGILVTDGGFSQPGEVLLAQDFMAAHQLSMGDSLTLLVSGRATDFTIAGSADSPEYVYVVKDAKELLPNPATFSIGYMPVDDMAAWLNTAGTYNHVCFTLEPGVTFERVKITLEDALKPYGVTALIPKKDQTSYLMLDTELTSISSMSTSIPFVFVAMAMVVLYLMLKRVMEQERMEIGTMKAFGYSNGKIVGHYLLYGGITGAVGGLLGVVFGYGLINMMTELYSQYFKLPVVEENTAFVYMAAGFATAVAGGMLGAYMGVRKVTKLLPADAMRPEAPKLAKWDPVKKVKLLLAILDTGGVMAVRSMARNPFRALFIVMGVMFSFGMLAFMGSFNSMFDDMLINQFTKVQRYDMKVSLQTPVHEASALSNVDGGPGVVLAEGILELPVVLHHAHLNTGSIITGVKPDSTLYKIYDNDLKANFPPPDKGIIISNSLAQKLEAKAGDILRIESPLLPEDVPVAVTGIVTQNLGSSCAMDMDALAGIFAMENSVTAVMVQTNDMPGMKKWLQNAKNVAVLEDKADTLASYVSFLGSYTYLMGLMQVMGAVVAFAIIYNTAAISLSERKREFATLRVLGMYAEEVGGMMGLEYWFLCLLGIGLGVPFTLFLKISVSNMMDVEMFTIPTYTPPSAYLQAIAGCMAAVWVANRSTMKNIRRFELVDALKERE